MENLNNKTEVSNKRFAFYKKRFHNCVSSPEMVAKVWEIYTRTYFEIMGREYYPQPMPIQGMFLNK